MYHVIECLKRLYKKFKNTEEMAWNCIKVFMNQRKQKSRDKWTIFFCSVITVVVDGGTLVRGSAVIKINLVQHYVWLFIHEIMITCSWMVATKLYLFQLGQWSHFKWKFILQYWLYWQFDVFLKLDTLHFCCQFTFVFLLDYMATSVYTWPPINFI